MSTRILYEGECAYVVPNDSQYEIVVFSSNHVTHITARIIAECDRAEQICQRFNAYPRQTRHAFGLL